MFFWIFCRYKHLVNEIQSKELDIEQLRSEAALLSEWAKNDTAEKQVESLYNRWQVLATGFNKRKLSLESEIEDCSAYHHLLQETEKWLLQVSFQLMGHNSLRINNLEHARQQIAQHDILLDQIQK